MALGRVKKISFKKEMKKISYTHKVSLPPKKEEQRKSNITREEEKRKLSYAQVVILFPKSERKKNNHILIWSIFPQKK